MKSDATGTRNLRAAHPAQGGRPGGRFPGREICRRGSHAYSPARQSRAAELLGYLVRPLPAGTGAGSPAEIILERFAADSEFVFLPVAYTDSKESLDKFFAGDEQQNYAYLRDLTAMDPDKRVFGLYAEQGVPRSFIIDRNGRIVLGSLGAAQEELERIAAAIEKELSR